MIKQKNVAHPERRFFVISSERAELLLLLQHNDVNYYTGDDSCNSNHLIPVVVNESRSEIADYKHDYTYYDKCNSRKLCHIFVILFVVQLIFRYKLTKYSSIGETF